MKVRYKGFEFEIETENDLELFKKFVDLLAPEDTPGVEPREASPEVRERALSAYLKKHEDHPELKEFAEFLRSKGLKDSTMYAYVTKAHKYILHEASTSGLSGYAERMVRQVKKLWGEFCKGKKTGLSVLFDDDDTDYDLHKAFHEDRKVLEGTIR
jgi:hypothetical protein